MDSVLVFDIFKNSTKYVWYNLKTDDFVVFSDLYEKNIENHFVKLVLHFDDESVYFDDLDISDFDDFELVEKLEEKYGSLNDFDFFKSSSF